MSQSSNCKIFIIKYQLRNIDRNHGQKREETNHKTSIRREAQLLSLIFEEKPQHLGKT